MPIIFIELTEADLIDLCYCVGLAKGSRNISSEAADRLFKKLINYELRGD